MDFPLTITKGKEKAKVLHAPDLEGWLSDGWKVEGETETKKPVAKPEKAKTDIGLDL